MVRTRRFHCQGPGSVPGRGTKSPTSRVVQPQTDKTDQLKGSLADMINLQTLTAVFCEKSIPRFPQ